MTRDLDALLRDADPLRGRSSDDAVLLHRVRGRVDADRTGVDPAGHRRSPWPRRLTLIAAAAGTTAGSGPTSRASGRPRRAACRWRRRGRR